MKKKITLNETNFLFTNLIINFNLKIVFVIKDYFQILLQTQNIYLWINNSKEIILTI